MGSWKHMEGYKKPLGEENNKKLWPVTEAWAIPSPPNPQSEYFEFSDFRRQTATLAGKNLWFTGHVLNESFKNILSWFISSMLQRQRINLYFDGLSPEPVSSTMPAIKNYTYTLLFPEDIKAELRLQKETFLKKKKTDGSNFQRNWFFHILMIRYTSFKHWTFHSTLLSFMGNLNRCHHVFLWVTATAALRCHDCNV